MSDPDLDHAPEPPHRHGDRFDPCTACEHYRGEHTAPDGSCTCDVLVTLDRYAPTRWERCTCPTFIEAAG